MRRPEDSSSLSVRSDSTLGPMGLRVAVIGAQTAEPESANPYTVYRTVATYDGQCYERSIRYSEFLWFYKKLKFRKRASAPNTSFPKKKWTRKSSLEDDVIEARQVLLNEFVREVSRSELTPESEQCLLKLLKIGKHDDGRGRVSDLRVSLQSSFLKRSQGERSARRGPLGVVPEADEEGDKPKTELAAAATLTATSVAFPAVSSNATTVLTEEERSAIGSQSRFRVDSHVPMLGDEEVPRSQTQSAEGASVERSQTNSRSPPHSSQSTSTIAPSSYSDMVLNGPQLKASKSLHSGRRAKHGKFPSENEAPESVPPPIQVDAAVEKTDMDCLSPEAKYRDRIITHLGTISRLLSESEAETDDMESGRSIQNLLPVPLTA